MYIVTKEAAKAGLAFCCLQEVKYRNFGKKLIRLNSGECYEFHWAGNKKKREAGVGILVRVDPNIQIKDPDIQTARLITMDLVIYGFNVRLINAYSPTDSGQNETKKDLFYRELRNAFKSKTKHQKVIVAGDFNAETSLSYYKSEFDGSGFLPDDECNGNGTRLKSFCREKKLGMASTFFDYPRERRYTWFSPDKHTRKKSDYVLTEKYVQRYVTDCSTNSSLDFDTDHRILITALDTPKSKAARKQCKRNTFVKKLDTDKLTEKEPKKMFIDAVENQLQEFRQQLDSADSSSESKSDLITVALKNAASSVLPEKSKKIYTGEIWKDDEFLNNLLKQRAAFSRGTNEYKSFTNKIKKRVRDLRNIKYRQEANQINEYANRKQVEKLYRSMKSDNSAFKDVAKRQQCDPGELQKFFSKHFNDAGELQNPREFQAVPEFVTQLQEISQSFNIAGEAPTKVELKTTIKNLKNGKAANDIPLIYLKSAIDSKKFLDEMVKLYETVWRTEQIPKSWAHSKLVAIWKGSSKGKPDNPLAYRALQIGSSLCKVLVVVIINRIKSWYEAQLQDQQQGFRKGRGTTDGTYHLKRIHQITASMKKPVYLAFIDLTAAFDHVIRPWLFESILQRLSSDENKKLFQLLNSLYSYTTSAMAETPDKIFELITGVRQGGPESPILYNLYMDYVMRVFLEKCKEKGIKFLKLKYRIPNEASPNNTMSIGTTIMDWLGYADDLVLMLETREDLQKALSILDITLTRFKLEINLTKTKTMVLNHQNLSDPYPTSIIKLNGKDVENVEVFLYLGSKVKYNEPATGDTELELRVNVSEAKFYEHSQNFMNSKIYLTTRVKILNALVRSRLTYSCQAWSITKKQLEKITSTYCAMLRKMIKGGYRRRPGTWSYVLSNEDLLRLGKTESISTFVSRMQRNYASHVVRKENTSTLKRLMFNDDDRRRTGRTTTLLKTVIANERLAPGDFFKNAINRVY